MGGWELDNGVSEAVAEFAGEGWISGPLEFQDIDAAGIEGATDPIDLLFGVGHAAGGSAAFDEFCDFIAN